MATAGQREMMYHKIREYRRTKPLFTLEAYQPPLFMGYHDNQPWNGNMLHPCPVLDNPERYDEEGKMFNHAAFLSMCCL